MIIAVDFDGTIVEGDRIERAGAIRALKALQERGFQIIIWTCREDEWLADGIEWLREQGFVPDAVNANIYPCTDLARHKILADVYFDDRSFPPFEGWDAVEEYFLRTELNNSLNI